ncbi:TonB-dependent hemoglobin/transferrin/lactoferrin family receptor [Xanthobacter sp. V4C-4]|uniref:TonB-dependent hemoglobin/transferrin/lactoferrin family receptor n=1 Tax=Xanthobacter cornucopiae TaxID=3119924 RepID=UPI003728EDFF
MVRGPSDPKSSTPLRHLFLGGAAAGALLLGAGAALAQSATATATPAAASDDIALDTLTVAATRGIETRAVDALAGVSIITSEELTELMASTTQQVFFGVPGTTVIQNGNSTQASINIRGMQDFGRVAVIVDGARQNFTQLGHNDGAGSFFLEPALLSTVDVVRGPVANVYGSGAIGGVVSFRTKDADDLLKSGQQWGVETSGEFGANGPMGFGSAFAATRLGPNADLFFGGTVRAQSQYTDGDGNEVLGTGYDTWTGIAKLTVRPAEFHEVKLTALNLDSTYTTGNTYPGTGTTQYATDVTNRTVTASYNYSNPDNAVFDWRSSAYWNQVGQDQTKVDGVCSSSTGCIGDPRSFTIDTLGFDVNNTSRLDLAAVKNAITVGGDYFHDKVDNQDNFGFGAGYNPSGERSVGGAFVQWQADWTKWLQTIAAVRWDAYELSSDTAPGTSGDRFSPKITVGVSPFEWITFYATYAEGYRAPSVTEALVNGEHPSVSPYFSFGFLPNPELQAEVGKNKEIGVNIKYNDLFMKGDKIRAKANLYRNDVSNYIDIDYMTGAVPACAAAGWTLCYQYQNVAEAQLQGFEFESMYDTGLWFAGFNATVSSGDNQTDGQPLTSVMPNTVATTLGTRLFDRRLQASVRWQWVAAKTEADLPAGSAIEPTPSFNLVNAYLAYQATEWVSAQFALENLLNEQYTQYQQFVPSAGITFKAGLKVTLGGDVIAAATPARIVK